MSAPPAGIQSDERPFDAADVACATYLLSQGADAMEQSMEPGVRRRGTNKAVLAAAALFVVGGVLTGMLVLGPGVAGVLLGAVFGLGIAWVVVELTREETWRRPPRSFADGVPYKRSQFEEEADEALREFEQRDEADSRADLARLDAKRRMEHDGSDLKGPPPIVPFP